MTTIGQVCKYNDKEYTIFSIKGQYVTLVDKNNNQIMIPYDKLKNQSVHDINKYITQADENIENYVEEIKKNQDLWKTTQKTIAYYNDLIKGLLGNADVKNANQLSLKDKGLYSDYSKELSNAKTLHNRASSNVIGFCTSCINEIYHKDDLKRQQTLSEYMA